MKKLLIVVLIAAVGVGAYEFGYMRGKCAAKSEKAVMAPTPRGANILTEAEKADLSSTLQALVLYLMILM